MEAIVDEAHRKGLRVAAHAHGVGGVKEAVLTGLDTIEHGRFGTQIGAEEREVLDLMANKGVTFVPNLAHIDRLGNRGEQYGFLRAAIERAKELLELTAEEIKVAHD